MVSVAAALSYVGIGGLTYTIVPFCYARAFEQSTMSASRPGGEAAGVWRRLCVWYNGPTHHALETTAFF
jgi:transketolase